MRPSPRWLLLLILVSTPVRATPPDYATFGRPQSATFQPEPADVLRIWAFDIGQGDSLLIQLPPRFSYDSDGDGAADERIDILVDAGPANNGDASRSLVHHINALYPQGAVLEHVVITHHDLDHIGGLTALLADPRIGVDTIYHNGLASYRRDARRLQGVQPNASNAILDRERRRGGQIKRVMGLVDADGQIQADFLIDDKADLAAAFEGHELQGVYEDLARAVLTKDDPFEVAAFQRVTEGSSFIMETEAAREDGLHTDEIAIDAIWPLERPREFGGRNWGESINGNSVTFRLAYRNFSMLFTGDHNEHSEEALRRHLGQDTHSLDCDVLKVPHHGSAHFDPAFFELPALSPVLSVASEGPQGFFTNWKHPSTDLIRRLGRSHRVYNTFVHERLFSYDDRPRRHDREPLVEEKHVLVETDGDQFRIVEVGLDQLPEVPSVQQTRRGDGTRWIRAR